MDGSRRDAAPVGETEILMNLLNAVQENSAVTQRSISRELGIALGLANAYLRRCVSKGLIKIAEVPPNRFAYYLTPTGFSEKSRLTTEYLSQSFNLFRAARAQCGELIALCAANGWRRVALHGIGDVAEIVMLSARDYDVRLVGIIDETAERTSFAGLPVVRWPSELGCVDAVLITGLTNAQDAFDRLVRRFPQERVLAPRLLNVTRVAPMLME